MNTINAAKRAPKVPMYPHAAELLAVMAMVEATCVYKSKVVVKKLKNQTHNQAAA